MSDKTAVGAADDNDKCENCGACKHCGAGGRQQFVPMPYPVYPNPFYPNPYAQPYRPYIQPQRPWLGGTSPNISGGTPIQAQGISPNQAGVGGTWQSATVGGNYYAA